jgi:hypothetical protein
MRRALLLALFSFGVCARTLDVYLIDVEGGKAMLTVAPSGESLLVDLGFPGFNGRGGACCGCEANRLPVDHTL